jgi:hypothetical protein
MSFWIHTKDRNGRPTTVLVDLPPIGMLVAVVACLVTQVGFFYYNEPTRLGWHSMGTMAVGVMALVLAKASLFRQGIWRSWGPGRMTRPFRALYVIAYALMGVGVFLGCIYLLGNM